MRTSYSIAQARDQLAQLVHDAEAGSLIQLTRRGQPVAVLLSFAEYERLKQDRPPFQDALARFQKDADLDDDDLGALRDRSPGRDVPDP
jgi:prevent-host-death family protein